MRVLAAVFIAAALSAAPETGKQKKSHTGTSLTGCLDQRGERYILSSEADMSKVTTLLAKGFSNDNFARYIGKKVTVKGAHKAEVFEVTKIETVSETCSR